MVKFTFFSAIPTSTQGKSSRCGRIPEFSHASAVDDAMREIRFMASVEMPLMEQAPVRRVVQISTMVHAEKDWAFIALCDDGSLWLYHGSWSRIEGIPQTTDL